MDTSPIGRGPNDVTTIAGDAQVEQAIATLVMAFGSDPVERWIYADPPRYLKHIPRLFRVEGETVARIVPLDGKEMAVPRFSTRPPCRTATGHVDVPLCRSGSRRREARDAGARNRRGASYGSRETVAPAALSGMLSAARIKTAIARGSGCRSELLLFGKE
jgi:hypothetical protein